MNDIPVNPNNMVETSDSLEAVGVFRAWKSVFFVIVLICLVLIQATFWAVDMHLVETPGEVQPAATDPAVAPAETSQAKPAGEGFMGGVLGKFDFEMLARVTGVANGVLIVAGVLFALTVFFCLTVSLVGRLGGINHISRAFILALIMAALIIPWQKLFGSNVVGVAYGSDELLRWLDAKDAAGLPNVIFYYLRFCGLWLVVLLLLIMTQVRSLRWSKSIIRRLEII
ncbi:MAG: hypothetical protein ABFD90_15365 [Phycisphaerales bacterium]